MKIEKNKTYCPECCKEINLNDLLIGIGGCVYCPKNKIFINEENNLIKMKEKIKKVTTKL